MKTIKFTLTVACTVWSIQLIAQISIPTVFPPAPVAASLAKFVDVPVSLYTGTPQIDIPIYNLQCGNLSVPISMSYYASGIKVEDASTGYGLGWVLNAGGMITRAIRGNIQGDAVSPYVIPLPISSSPSSADWNYIYTAAYVGTGDEADIFYYNFNGHIGSFYFKSGIPVLKRYDDIKIEYTSSVSWAITGFIITTKDGIRYYFGENSPGLLYATDKEWYLKKIESSDNKHSINFEYTVGNSYIQVPRNSKYYEFNNYSPIPYLVSNTPGNMYVWEHAGQLISKIYTSNNDQIQFDTKTMQYTESNVLLPCKALDFMTAYNCRNEQIKKIKFNTNNIKTIKPYSVQTSGYPYVGYDSGVNYRIYLDGITEYSTDGQTIDWNFEYFGRTASGQDSLPSSLSLAQDMGGFYNGKDANTTLIPTWDEYIDPSQTVTGFNPCINYRYPYERIYIPGADRTTDFGFLKMGTLKSIKYPTKGSTKFVYSQKINPVTQNPYWGMNIDEIRYFAQEGAFIKRKKYKYENATLGHNLPAFHAYTFSNVNVNAQFHFYPDCPTPSSAESYRPAIELNAGPREDLGLFEGAVIGYGKVTEYEEGNGYTVYEYSNEDGYREHYTYPLGYIYKGSQNPADVYHLSLEIGKDFWPLGPFENNSWKRGTLLKQETFRNDGTSLQKMVYNYSFIELQTVPNIKIHPRGAGAYFYYQYDLVSSWIKLNSISETSNGMTKVTSFEYNSAFHKQKSREVTHLSNQAEKTIEYKYPQDFSSVQPYSTMLAQFRISPVIEEIEKVNNLVTQTTRTNYSFWNSNNNLIYPSSIETSKSGNTPEPRIRYHGYDADGNVTSVSKENGPKVNYLYSYKGSYPVAKIENVDYAALETVLGAQTINNLRDYTNSTAISAALAPLRTHPGLQNAQMTTFTYAPLVGMTSMTDAKGQTTRYEYDSFQRLSTVRDHSGNIIQQYCYNYAGQQTSCPSVSVPVVVPTGGGTQTIYVRSELTNPSTTGGTNSWGYIWITDYADWDYRFYSDEACTQPYTLTSDLEIGYYMSYVYSYPGGSSPWSYTGYFVTPSGNSSDSMGSAETFYYEEYDYDPDWGALYDCWTYDYGTIPGSGYQPISTYRQ